MRLRGSLLLALAALLGLSTQGSAAAPTATRAAIGSEARAAVARDGEAKVIVALRVAESAPQASLASRVHEARTARSSLLERLGPRSGFRPTDRWDAVAAVPGIVTADGLARLAASPDVLRVDVDLRGRGADAESLPLVRGDAAHAAGASGRGVTVAVLDTGIDKTHPDLADAVVAEACFVYPNGCPNGANEQVGPGSGADDHGHGTNVAGIVASNGGIAPIGVAPAASLVSVKVLDRNNGFQTLEQIIAALNWVALNRPDVRVVNMSLGTFARFPGNCDNVHASTIALASAVSALRARGVVVFAATLNDASPSTMSVPACISGVVSVGAVYDSAVGAISYPGVCQDAAPAPDRVTCFSNSSPELDLLAPGALITSTAPGGTVSTFAGTSQATPHAAGAAALLLERTPSLSADAVEGALESTGVMITDQRNGLARPRIDIAAALGVAQPEPAMPDIAIDRRTLDFGSVRAGRQKRLTIVVRNDGNAPLTVTSSVPRPFSIVSGRTLRLATAGARGRVVVAFAPPAARLYRATLTLTSNDPDEARVRVPVRGRGTPRT